mgnify:CR=1 FL=1
MIPAVYQPQHGKVGPGFAPGVEGMEKMGRFNDELRKAGALISLDGLQPLSSGARIAFAGGNVTTTDGPDVDAKEVVGGFWISQVDSKQEAIDWMKRCPAQNGDSLAIRRVAEMSDFPPETQAVPACRQRVLRKLVT